jgi:hypothetical protein
MSSQLQAASVMAGNKNFALPQYSYYVPIQNTSTFVQPDTNTELPAALYSNMEKSSNNETTPNVSSSGEMSCKKLSTKEMCMTSEMTHITTHSHISSTSNISSTANKEDEWKQTKHFCNKRQEEKQSCPDSDASVTSSSSNGSAQGASSKVYREVTVTACGTSVLEDLTKWAQPSKGSEGKFRLTVYTIHTFFEMKLEIS